MGEPLLAVGGVALVMLVILAGFAVVIAIVLRSRARTPAPIDAPLGELARVQSESAGRLEAMIGMLAKKEEEKEPRVFINPEVHWTSEEKATYEEGCLSIPEFYEDVERPAQVRVKYLDLEGRVQELEASGLLATCLQHEIDHLNGVLFIDHISRLKRERVVKKFSKAAKRAAVE